MAGKNNSVTFMAYVYMLCTILCFDEVLFLTWQRPLKGCWPEQADFFTRKTTLLKTFKLNVR